MKCWDQRELQLLGIFQALVLQCMLAAVSQKTFSNQVSALAHTYREPFSFFLTSFSPTADYFCNGIYC